jgi:hypothetical protein
MTERTIAVCVVSLGNDTPLVIVSGSVGPSTPEYPHARRNNANDAVPGLRGTDPHIRVKSKLEWPVFHKLTMEKGLVTGMLRKSAGKNSRPRHRA